MRIQCKSCGKEYRVDERRLTSEGVRVKCRSCGAVLMIRLRGEAESRSAAVPTHSPEVSAAATPPAVLPEGPHSAEVQPPEPEAQPHRFCMACGRPLEHPVPRDELPLCGGRRCQTPAASTGTPKASAPAKRILLLIAALAVLLAAAFLGYRLAAGSYPIFALSTEQGGAPVSGFAGRDIS